MAAFGSGSPRRNILVLGILLQVCLGTVYAWSYFQQPLVQGFGWQNTQVAWVFSLAICFLGLAAAVGGKLLPRTGPRLLATLGGCLYGLGYLLAALALHVKSLPLLYVGCGAVGGIGLGLGYVTPVATVAKWFPDRKGLATGAVVMGFGIGAIMMSKLLAPLLMSWTGGNMAAAFAWLGVFFTLVAGGVGLGMRNPPVAAGMPVTPVASSVVTPVRGMRRRFLLMWLVFFCNIASGIAIISFQSPLLQDLLIRTDARFESVPQLRALERAEKRGNGTAMAPEQRRSLNELAGRLARIGATLIAFSSIFNGIGRFFWGGLSDRIGRTCAFRWMLGTQVLAFGLLRFVNHPLLFGALVCYILLCYGGGFGVMPSYVLAVFGPARMAAVYGAILTAWSAAGVVGPQVVACVKDRYGANATGISFGISAGLLTAGLLLSLALHDRSPDRAVG